MATKQYPTMIRMGNPNYIPNSRGQLQEKGSAKVVSQPTTVTNSTTPCCGK